MAFLGIHLNHDISRLLSGIDVPGEKTPVSQFHITLLYFQENWPMTEIAKALEATHDIVSKTNPFLVKINKVSCFIPKFKKDKCAIIALLDSSELHDLHDQLARQFEKCDIEFSKTYKDYKPHITLAYHDKTIKDFKLDTEIEFSVQEVVLWCGDEYDDRLIMTFPFRTPEKQKHSQLSNQIELFHKLAHEPRHGILGGLSSHTSPKELKNALRKLILRYHPDNPETGNAEKFREVMEAYQSLTQASREMPPKVIVEPAMPKHESTLPARAHQWGDWYSKSLRP